MVYYRQNGEINLSRHQAGNLAFAQTNKDLSVWRHVKIAALADRIKVWVDGTLFIDYYEPSPPFTTGHVAFYSKGVNPKFDNLVVSNLGTQQKTYYIYSGDVPIAEYDAGGALLAEYVYANGQRVAKINADGAMHYYLTDHLGSTRVAYGSNWNANYHAYGEVAAQSGSEAENKYTFTGKEKDSGTGLTYFGWRYYDPVLGRWLTLDPAGQGWSPYAYAGNSPVIMVDPDGRLAWFVPILIGAGIGAIGGGVYAHNTGGEWWQGALAGAVVGGSLGYFAGAAAGATPLLASTAANGAVAGAALGTGWGMADAGSGKTGWDNVWKYGLTGAVAGASIGFGAQNGMFGFSPQAISWKGLGNSALFWSGIFASANSMESMEHEYLLALLEGAGAGAVYGGVSYAWVAGTDIAGGWGFDKIGLNPKWGGYVLRTPFNAYVGLSAQSQSKKQNTPGLDHGLVGFGFGLVPFNSFFQQAGNFMVLDDFFQTQVPMLGRNGYGSPLNTWYREQFLKHRPWVWRSIRRLGL